MSAKNRIMGIEIENKAEARKKSAQELAENFKEVRQEFGDDSMSDEAREHVGSGEGRIRD